ncbi:hypothetical protein CO670_23885 [Rhizobium sp. J15]|nr:hypothetical protein CO670_23885 [Rhizobium sp. J15]
MRTNPTHGALQTKATNQAIAVAPKHSSSLIRQLGSRAKMYKKIAPAKTAAPAMAMDIQSLAPCAMIKAATKTAAKGRAISQSTNVICL